MYVVGKKQTWQLTMEYGLPNFQHVCLVNQEAELYLKCFDTKFMTPKFTESTLPFPNNYVRLQGWTEGIGFKLSVLLGVAWRSVAICKVLTNEPRWDKIFVINNQPQAITNSTQCLAQLIFLLQYFLHSRSDKLLHIQEPMFMLLWIKTASSIQHGACLMAPWPVLSYSNCGNYRLSHSESMGLPKEQLTNYRKGGGGNLSPTHANWENMSPIWLHNYKHIIYKWKIESETSHLEM